MDDFDAGAWWKVSFLTDMSDAGLTGVWNLHFMRIMSEHNSRRFQGDWRLGDTVLVTFQQADSAPLPVVVPKFNVHITFRVSAPGQGPHSEAIAEEVGTVLRAVTSFATAAPLLGTLTLFPAQDEEIAEAASKI